MATRKENIDIEYDEPQQEAVSGAVESCNPYESQDPADWVPPMTVRIYPISKPRTKLLATANVNIAKSFAVQGFRIYDSKNGLFVKEPQRSYVKNGTEMTSSVFFPVTKEARDALYSQILNSYELVMEQQERQHPNQKDELEELLEDGDLPFAQPYEAPPPPTLTLKLKKKDSQTGSTPQGNASLAGAVYQVSYQKGGETVTEELTSDAQGNLGTLEGIPFGTISVKELSAPEGYRLDTEVHTYWPTPAARTARSA